MKSLAASALKKISVPLATSLKLIGQPELDLLPEFSTAQFRDLVSQVQAIETECKSVNDAAAATLSFSDVKFVALKLSQLKKHQALVKDLMTRLKRLG